MDNLVVDYDDKKTDDDGKKAHTKKGISSKLEKVDLTKALQKIRKCKAVVISADSIFEDGGILSQSGALMVAIAAKKYGVPVLAVGRGFSLTEKVVSGMATLLENENPLDYFDYKEGSEEKVLIAKKYDYIEPSLIFRVVTELGECAPAGIFSQFKEYYP